MTFSVVSKSKETNIDLNASYLYTIKIMHSLWHAVRNSYEAKFMKIFRSSASVPSETSEAFSPHAQFRSITRQEIEELRYVLLPESNNSHTSEKFARQLNVLFRICARSHFEVLPDLMACVVSREFQVSLWNKYYLASFRIKRVYGARKINT